MEPPFISVVIPALNEERHIGKCLDQLLECAHPADRMELIVADGGSTDRTRQMVEAASDWHGTGATIKVVNNPLRLTGPGVNAGAGAADPRSEWIVRCDAHAEYPAGFIDRVVAAIERLPPRYAAVVYVVRISANVDCFRKATGWAFNSRIGAGRSAYRSGHYTGPVDHGWHGVFRKDVFVGLRGYDPTFDANEDLDLSRRIRLQGDEIMMDSSIDVRYIPRGDLRGLWRQFYRYGQARARTVRKHGAGIQPRHMPMIGLALWTILVAGASPWAPWLWFSLLPYAALLAAIGVTKGARDPCLLWTPLVVGTMHYAWGFGFIAEWFLHRKPAPQ